MARVAAFGPALEEIKEVKPIERGKNATKRAKESAIGTLREDADRQQYSRIELIGPCARKFRRNRSLERLNLGGGARAVDAGKHQHENRRGSDVFSHPQPLLERRRRVPLR